MISITKVINILFPSVHLLLKSKEEKKTGLALRMTDLTKNIWFAVFLREFEMMFIINAFALVKFATILYITLKRDIYLNRLLFHSEVVFTLFFWYEVEFLLSCWLRQCWSSDMLTYFIVHFSSEKIDWSWIKQSAASQTRFLTNKCILKQSICPWQCQ